MGEVFPNVGMLTRLFPSIVWVCVGSIFVYHVNQCAELSCWVCQGQPGLSSGA
jgi:hypothetical protein